MLKNIKNMLSNDISLVNLWLVLIAKSGNVTLQVGVPGGGGAQEVSASDLVWLMGKEEVLPDQFGLLFAHNI